MIQGVPFQTKARTVDHLGREQIADCPTAISELWKNAFDAYARKVELNIYDGAQAVAVISDDGHGMSREEFVSRWLVVGTKSKATADRTPSTDRNGLYVRPRQGQKGIGRLSCANLGPILLLVSKRRRTSFVAALVDWRLFENPFINLSDVFIPIAEFEEKEELFEQLPGLIAALAENLTGGMEEERGKRLREAWAAYDRSYFEELEEGGSNKLCAPSEEVKATIAGIDFQPRHLEQWDLWSGEADHGTALLVSHINYDLRVELDVDDADPSARAARERFFETLSSFVDPFVDPAAPGAQRKDPHFAYAVRSWTGRTPRLNSWRGEAVRPPATGRHGAPDRWRGRHRRHIPRSREGVRQLGKRALRHRSAQGSRIPHRPDTHVGPFEIYIATMEFTAARTTIRKQYFSITADWPNAIQDS